MVGGVQDGALHHGAHLRILGLSTSGELMSFGPLLLKEQFQHHTVSFSISWARPDFYFSHQGFRWEKFLFTEITFVHAEVIYVENF